MASKQSNNRVENAAEYIRNKIIKGEFLPGSHIVESSIATALNMSRGPIRDALKILEKEGMVCYEVNKGCTVVFLSPKEVWESFFMRGHLEKIALEVSGGSISYPYLMAMEAALQKMEAAQKNADAEQVVYWDNVFHEQIISNSDMERLQILWKSLSPLNMAMFFSGKRTSTFDFSNQWEKHVQLYKIIAKGNLLDSSNAIMEHYLTPGKKIYQASL